MTIDTPSLSELAAELRDASEKLSLWEHLTINTPLGQVHICDLIDRAADTLSRLSGNGGGFGGAATPSASLEEDLAEALVIMAGHGIEPDVQELLIYGNPSRGIKRGALAAAMRKLKAPAASERLSPPNLEPQCGVGEVNSIATVLADALSGMCLGSAEMEEILWGSMADDQMGTCTFRLGALRKARKALASYQAASAAAPTPIDDGAVERLRKAFDGFYNCHKIFVSCADPHAAAVWDEFIASTRALQASQTKT